MTRCGYTRGAVSLVVLGVLCTQALTPAAAQAPVQNRQIQSQSSSLELRLRRLEQGNRAALGLLTEISALRREVQTLRNENEKLANRLEKTERRLEGVARKQEQQPSPVSPAPTGEQIASAPEPEVKIESNPDAQVAYQAAVDKLMAGEYADASKHFEALLSEHGEGAYASRAQYFLAESYYQQGQTNKALGAYRKLVEAYPNDPKVPESGLKIADLLDELGQRKEARSTLEGVARSYPGTSFASMAQQRLEELR